MLNKLRMLRHNVLAHPIAGILWLLGQKRLGDWVHDTL